MVVFNIAIVDGSFLTSRELAEILDRWRLKMNLILQGPPGTGKTWLAKRPDLHSLAPMTARPPAPGYALCNFILHLPTRTSCAGGGPAGDGRLELVDGILMQAIQAAESEPDRPFVLVIEEINRGNPPQIFGEMLTLLEVTKRRRSEAIELAYRKEPGERVHVPRNLYFGLVRWWHTLDQELRADRSSGRHENTGRAMTEGK